MDRSDLDVLHPALFQTQVSHNFVKSRLGNQREIGRRVAKVLVEADSKVVEEAMFKKAFLGAA